MLKKLLVPAAVAILAIPFAVAHVFPDPVTTPCAPLHDHHYATGSSANLNGIATATWRTTVVLTDSCETYDGEGDFGVGGGFLPASHHNAYQGVCVADITGTTVDFWIGAKGPSGGIVSVSPLLSGCGSAFDANGAPIAPGVDGGWWIFLANSASLGFTSSLNAPPTAGHICSAPAWAC